MVEEEPRYMLDDDDVQFPLTTKSGRVISEADVDAMAAEALRGYDVSIGPQGAAMVARGLEERQAFWRERLGDEDYARALAHWRRQASEHPQRAYTCPRCGMTSYNANDIEQGYCGNCHDWTGVNVQVDED